MLTNDFYELIDHELLGIIEKYKDDAFLKKQKGEQGENNKKSYAFLIWFLEFYARRTEYLPYITDSNSLVNRQSEKTNSNITTIKDGDASCDLIIDSVDNFGNKVFYIIQSKWNNANKCQGEIERGEIVKALNDFETILRGDVHNVNSKLTKKLDELYDHLKNNGDVKFVFLCLCKKNSKADDNITSFLRGHERTKLEIIDIDRLKIDYIDRKYKKIEPINPLENYYDPQEIKVPIQIERLSAKNGNYIKIEKPFDAYVFLIRPKTLFNLFDKYGFYLFYKNVRNPLLQSQFNEDIERTATENPEFFWYYNNGITAITYSPFPRIRSQAESIELNGLQIINGSQTVYSIYRSYKNASPAKKAQMDEEILITLRLLKSGGKDFDLNVTRFTNSQNPVQDRDFCANDAIQERLQNSFYNTKFWYEKRRGEFRQDDPVLKDELINKNIVIVPNFVFANAYLAYYLQDPVSVFNNSQQMPQTEKDLIFISHKENKDGLYEKIFNDDIDYRNMLCAFYLFSVLVKITELRDFNESLNTPLYHLLALFKVAFTKYIHKKINSKIDVNLHIIKLYENRDVTLITKTFRFLLIFIQKEIGLLNKNTTEKHLKFLNTLSYYEKVREDLEDLDLDILEIENLEIQDGKPVFQDEFQNKTV